VIIKRGVLLTYGVENFRPFLGLDILIYYREK
jgi:hypothetical protein